MYEVGNCDLEWKDKIVFWNKKFWSIFRDLDVEDEWLVEVEGYDVIDFC